MFPRAGWSVLASLLVVGCYSPRIGDWLKCAHNAGKACPSGYVCDGEYCRSAGSDRAVERPSDADADSKADAMVDTSPDLKQPGAFCTVLNQGLPTQADDCVAGSVCMADGCDYRCYKFCREDLDCDNAACDRSVGGGMVCDVPFVACNPVGATSGCAGATVCYLSSSHPDRTICDCPFAAAGENADCARSRDCIRGLACVDRGNGRPICLRVCLLANDGADCPGGAGSCRPYRGAPAGSTNDTFGYCF
jgi:hypothetical protein